MGEYAKYLGEEIKIGTCEELMYLRWDQRHKVSGYKFELDAVRFRFPFPDEDRMSPGSFDDGDRGVPIPYTWKLPTDWDGHGIVQFTASAGYNVCLPCPESPTAADHGLHVHRNGFRGGPKVVAQRWWEGQLWTVVACGACGAKWRCDETVAAGIADAFRYDERGAKVFNVRMAERIMAGYSATVGA